MNAARHEGQKRKTVSSEELMSRVVATPSLLSASQTGLSLSAIDEDSQPIVCSA